MQTELLRIVESTTVDAESICSRTAAIHATVLGRSKRIRTPNFHSIHSDDLALLFAEYDGRFFSSQVKEALGTTPVHFRLSRRMTSSGGKTARFANGPDGGTRYEISASTAMLFGCFTAADHRPIVASGITCRDRLDALQRVMEHEMVHLIEMLLWGKSSCSQPRFHAITRRFFGHTENKHNLITPKEKAFVQFGIRPGVKVRFHFEGIEYTGVVNRVNKRATILVEDSTGQLYSDGKHYAKFYVPPQMLKTLG